MADATSTTGFYAARPVITLDGADEGSLTDALLSMIIEETTEGLYRCELTLGNWGTSSGGEVGFLFFDRSVFDFGKMLKISAGDGEASGVLFEGRITGLEGRFPQNSPPELLVLAEDRLQDLRMTRRTRVFEEVTDSEVFKSIAAAHSLRDEVEIDGPTYDVLAQVNQSDLAFLRDRARAIDAEFWVENDTLHAAMRSQRNLGEVTLKYGGGLRSFSVLADAASQRTSFASTGWDPDTKSAVTFVADEAAIQSELNGDESGASVLEGAFGPRPDSVVHMVPADTSEAQYYAESHFRTMARRFVTGDAVVEGDARLHVGTRVKLEGVGDLYNGTYYVASVCHTFESDAGFQTQISVERPGIGKA